MEPWRDLHKSVAGAEMTQVVHLFTPTGQQARHSRNPLRTARPEKQHPLVDWRRRPHPVRALSAAPARLRAAVRACGGTGRLESRPGRKLRLQPADRCGSVLGVAPSLLQGLSQLLPPARAARRLRQGRDRRARVS